MTLPKDLSSLCLYSCKKVPSCCCVWRRVLEVKEAPLPLFRQLILLEGGGIKNTFAPLHTIRSVVWQKVIYFPALDYKASNKMVSTSIKVTGLKARRYPNASHHYSQLQLAMQKVRNTFGRGWCAHKHLSLSLAFLPPLGFPHDIYNIRSKLIEPDWYNAISDQVRYNIKDIKSKCITYWYDPVGSNTITMIFNIILRSDIHDNQIWSGHLTLMISNLIRLNPISVILYNIWSGLILIMSDPTGFDLFLLIPDNNGKISMISDLSFLRKTHIQTLLQLSHQLTKLARSGGELMPTLLPIGAAWYWIVLKPCFVPFAHWQALPGGNAQQRGVICCALQ